MCLKTSLSLNVNIDSVLQENNQHSEQLNNGICTSCLDPSEHIAIDITAARVILCYMQKDIQNL
jgi:hypothetical protein